MAPSASVPGPPHPPPSYTMELVGSRDPSGVPTPKRPHADQRGAKIRCCQDLENYHAPGRKPRCRPPKTLKEEEEGILQESSEEEQCLPGCLLLPKGGVSFWDCTAPAPLTATGPPAPPRGPHTTATQLLQDAEPNAEPLSLV